MKPTEAAAISAAINALLTAVPEKDQEVAALRASDFLNNASLGVRFRVKEDRPFELVANVEKRNRFEGNV